MSRNHHLKHHRETLREAQRIAADHGGMVEFVPAKPHCKLRCSCRGQTSLLSLPGSPRDRDNARRNSVRDVKRAFRELSSEGRG